MRLIACRHTQTDDNANRIYSGQNDVDIDKTGKRQASRLAARIKQKYGSSIGAVLSSNLLRASRLAVPIGDQVGLEPVLTPALREVHIGRMTGLVREDALTQFPSRRHQTRNPFFDFTDIGGELAGDVFARQFDFLMERLQQLRSQGVGTVVVVGHGTALRLLLCQRLKLVDSLHDQGKFDVVDFPLG